MQAAECVLYFLSLLFPNEFSQYFICLFFLRRQFPRVYQEFFILREYRGFNNPWQLTSLCLLFIFLFRFSTCALNLQNSKNETLRKRSRFQFNLSAMKNQNAHNKSNRRSIKLACLFNLLKSWKNILDSFYEFSHVEYKIIYIFFPNQMIWGGTLIVMCQRIIMFGTHCMHH